MLEYLQQLLGNVVSLRLAAQNNPAGRQAYLDSLNLFQNELDDFIADPTMQPPAPSSPPPPPPPPPRR